MTRAPILLGIAIATIGGHVSTAQSPAVQQLYQKAHADQEAGRGEEAVADYRELLRLDPSISAAYNNLGRLYYNLGRFPEAVATLRQGLAIDPTLAPAKVMLGAAYLRLAQPKEALSPVEEGVRALPNDRFARLTLVRVLLSLKRPTDAVTQLNTLLAADPKDQEAWYLLGKVHLELSQQAFTEVQTIDPNTSLAHELDGEIMESMQNTPGAVAAYKQALAASPDDATALEHLANVYWSTGDWSHASEQLRTVVSKQPGNCVAHWKLADSLDELGEAPDAGLAEVNQALKLCPALPQAHAERARLLLRVNKPSEALPDLQIAEKSAPDEPSLQQLYAQAYRALGDPERAALAQRRFQQLEAREHELKEHHVTDVVRSNQ